MNATNIINRLNETLNARTEDALGQLAALEAQIADAVAQAEVAAASRIGDAVSRIESLLADTVAGSQSTIATLASAAIGGVIERLASRIDALARPAASVAIQAEVAPEESVRAHQPEDECVPTTVEALETERLDYQAWLAYRDEAHADGRVGLGYVDWLTAQTAEQTPSIDEEAANWASLTQSHTEQEVDMEPGIGGSILEPSVIPTPAAAIGTPAVAAQVLALETSAAFVPDGVLGQHNPVETPEDDGDEDEDAGDDPEDGEGASPANPVTKQRHGLFEDRGRGRRPRYVAVYQPVAGQTYYRKEGRRWVPYTFAE